MTEIVTWDYAYRSCDVCEELYY